MRKIFGEVKQFPVRADALQIDGRNLKKVIVAVSECMSVVNILRIDDQNIGGQKFVGGFVNIGGHFTLCNVKYFEVLMPVRRDENVGILYGSKIYLSQFVIVDCFVFAVHGRLLGKKIPV